MKSENPMSNFTLTLLNALNDIVNNELEEYEPLDNFRKLLLMNNGCGIEDTGQKIKCVSIEEDYAMEFITGAIGNDKNIFFDFYYGKNQIRTLVVFLDYFKEIKTEEPDEYDENGIRSDIIGNNNFFFAVKQISEIFMRSYFNPATLTGDFNSTVAGTNFRYLPCLIAGIIMNYFKPLTEDDTDGCGIEYSMLIDIISNQDIPIGDKLLGIRINNGA